MIDGGCFMRAGWVHQLKLSPYSNHEGEAFVAMGKVCQCQLNYVLLVYIVLHG